MQTPAEVAQDPVAHAAGCFIEVEDGSGARFLAPASPARLPVCPPGAASPVENRAAGCRTPIHVQLLTEMQ